MMMESVWRVPERLSRRADAGWSAAVRRHLPGSGSSSGVSSRSHRVPRPGAGPGTLCSPGRGCFSRRCGSG